MRKLFKHLQTIQTHRKYVQRACFKAGLIWRGLMHDLSKYTITELKICKYYTGDRSPHENCRKVLGYSPSWIQHYHKNKHHFQYFQDENELGEIIPIKMPYKYVIESFCDMVGAGKAYMKANWDITQPWEYYLSKCKGKRLMNEYSEYLLAKLLWNLHESNSEETFWKWYKQAKKYLKQRYAENNLDY